MPFSPTQAYDPEATKQKQTGGNDLAKSIEDIIGAGTSHALDLGAEENRRHGEMTDVILASAYGANADEAAGRYQQNIGNLNDILGAAGHTGGGYAAALAANYDLSRVGQILSANRATQLEAVKMNANKKMQDFNNTLALASAVGQSPSMIPMDWLTNVLGLRMEQYGQNEAMKQANKNAKASKQAGWMNLIGGIAGPLVGRLL
jgi:hypothetical protein